MKMLSQAAGTSMKGIYRLRFNPDMEPQYQTASVDHKKIPRVLLFTYLGLCFALAPLYQTSFFDVAGSANPWLRIFELYAVGPLSFAAALASYFGRWRLQAALVQSVAVVVLWVSPLFLRYLALHGGMQYPSSMIGIVVIGIAVFGGFNWYIFSLGSVIVLAVGAVQELKLGDYSTQAWLNVNALFLSGLIAVLGAYASEISQRLAWANGYTANLLARTDALTGLMTPAEFDRGFPALLLQARRDRCGIAIALLEIDHFSQINGSHGHAFGDEMLAALGLSLRTRLVRRPFDTAVRVGGGRMLVLWYGIPHEAQQRFAQSLSEAIQAVAVTTSAQQTVTITASCGLTWLMPAEGTRPSEILHDAERLLAQARAEGGNRILLG